MTTTPRRYKSIEHAARAWAKRNGYEGRLGGFIYRVGGKKHVCQGWTPFANILLGRGKIAHTNPKAHWLRGDHTAYIVEG